MSPRLYSKKTWGSLEQGMLEEYDRRRHARRWRHYALVSAVTIAVIAAFAVLGWIWR